jgi:hypothetical protein
MPVVPASGVGQLTAPASPQVQFSTIKPRFIRTLIRKLSKTMPTRLTGVTWSRPTCQASRMSAGRSGTADLPLHGGRVPAWLAARMARLGRVIVEAIAHEYGRTEVLRRLSSPFWFQSFGAVMGMDWHSSGITTSVIGALKRGLAPVENELGLHVCGGRGRHSRRTPDELTALGERVGLDAPALVRASRLVAKVDSAAVQDGFDLYLHGFFVADDGAWVVVQQGMNGARRQARRYHWLWDRAGAFIEEPHAAIEGRPVGEIVNLTDRRAAGARGEMIDLAHGGPDAAVGGLARLRMPAHHDVRAEDIDLKRLGKTLAAVAERGPQDFAELMLVPGVGARTLFALALVAEVIHGAPSRFADPARFSLAHGGKDGHPFPVPLKVYDETIGVLRRALARAKLGEDERLAAVRRLDDQARVIDGAAAVTEAEFERGVEREWAAKASLGGRTVADDARRKQLSLSFGRPGETIS